ncbi:outer membrane protein [Thermus phage TSP4]|nr:outer membrane protein [Thermus phage TSP4]
MRRRNYVRSRYLGNRNLCRKQPFSCVLGNTFHLLQRCKTLLVLGSQKPALVQAEDSEELGLGVSQLGEVGLRKRTHLSSEVGVLCTLEADVDLTVNRSFRVQGLGSHKQPGKRCPGSG